MSIDNNEKVRFRNLYLEVGLWCNLNCRHCYQGDPIDISIRPEYIDALCEKTYEIDELIFTGGEVSLYCDEIKMIMQKLIDNHVNVNYVGMITNAKEKNEKLADLFNWFRFNHTKFPNKSKIYISADKFHTSCDENFTNKELANNIEWFKKKYVNCTIIIRDRLHGISLQGNAKKLNENDFCDIKRVTIPKYDGAYDSINLKEHCAGKENLCGYNSVENCISSDIILGCDGYLFVEQDTPALNERNERNSIGHIMSSESIFNLVQKWNSRVERGIVIYIKADNLFQYRYFMTLLKLIEYRVDIYTAVEQNDQNWLDVIARNLDAEVENWNKYIEKYRVLSPEHKMDKKVIDLLNQRMGLDDIKIFQEGELLLVDTINNIFSGMLNTFKIAYMKVSPIINIFFNSNALEPLSETELKIYDMYKELKEAKREMDIEKYADAYERILKEMQIRI